MNKFKEMKEKLMTKMQPVVATATGVMVTANMAIVNAYADTTQTSVINNLKTVAGKVCIGFAAVIGLVGIISFARAQSDGDGPAKSKAIGELGGAIVLALVGTALSTMTF